MADLECITEDGRIVFAVEVKDQELTIAHVEGKLQNAREKKVKDILFIAQHGIAPPDERTLPVRVEEEFAKGQNLYILHMTSFAKTVFPLLGEEARPEFLRRVGSQLDQYRSDLRHRQAWRDLLAGG
jgi:Holliday junction resolvase-like predicted endonuclease